MERDFIHLHGDSCHNMTIELSSIYGYLGGVDRGENGNSSSVAEDHRHWQVGVVEGVQGLACRCTGGRLAHEKRRD